LLNTVAAFAPAATAATGAHTVARKESVDDIIEILDSGVLSQVSTDFLLDEKVHFPCISRLGVPIR
jgi:hypothetical protein